MLKARRGRPTLDPYGRPHVGKVQAVLPPMLGVKMCWLTEQSGKTRSWILRRLLEKAELSDLLEVSHGARR